MAFVFISPPRGRGECYGEVREEKENCESRAASWLITCAWTYLSLSLDGPRTIISPLIHVVPSGKKWLSDGHPLKATEWKGGSADGESQGHQSWAACGEIQSFIKMTRLTLQILSFPTDIRWIVLPLMPRRTWRLFWTTGMRWLDDTLRGWQTWYQIAAGTQVKMYKLWCAIIYGSAIWYCILDYRLLLCLKYSSVTCNLSWTNHLWNVGHNEDTQSLNKYEVFKLRLDDFRHK